MPQHEFEGRLLLLESMVLQVMDKINNLSDQVGKLQQDLMMTRPPMGTGMPTGARSAVVTTEITAAPGADELGVGVATIRTHDEENLSDWITGTVYSNFTTAVVVGTRIEVVSDNSSWKLVAADCP